MIYADRIRQWAHDRNLIQGSTVQAQFVKLIEEVGELAEAVAKGKDEQFLDSIGDAFVVLTILAAQKDLEIEECIAHAWDEIKDRKGRMVDGVFIRDL
jgi:NTP pyrophosphatase (non-canonical NTP hydrolase)